MVKRVAKFSLVVGRGNENYVELYAFAKKVSQAAESVHDGFGGAIIEKEYRYNGFVSNKAILLEVGNNKKYHRGSKSICVLFCRSDG